MNKLIQECKKCGIKCNGGGIGYIIVEAQNSIAIVIGNELAQLPDHACGEEHMLQIFAEAVRKLKTEDHGQEEEKKT